MTAMMQRIVPDDKVDLSLTPQTFAFSEDDESDEESGGSGRKRTRRRRRGGSGNDGEG